MLWALEQDVEPMAKLVLLVLADQADSKGRGAYPAVGTVATTVPCDRATVQRRLRDLEQAGLLRQGDQELVAHYRADRRPKVYDLVLDGAAQSGPVAGPRGRTDRGHGAADGAAPVRPNPRETQRQPHGAAAARGETADGAVAGCADHLGRRRPACEACQRVQPLAREQVRPASKEARAAARAALTAERETPCTTSPTSPPPTSSDSVAS